ncbi:MAG: cytochrome b/b6 domain-containing protein [Bacillota bacterium]|nr:cytochrome b/b6 domain-containing protein [Bacillota bacterium]
MTQQLPRHPRWLRVLHWLHTGSMLVLLFSGFYITYVHRAFLFSRMDTARLWHFAAAYLIVWTWVARLYFGLATGEYRELIPRRSDLRELPALVRYYLFLAPEVPDYGKYNPGQKLLYSFWPFLLLLQALTGFALYDPNRLQWLWMHDWLLNLNTVRTIHYLTAVFFAVTTAAHLYLVLTEDLDKLQSMLIDPAERRR